MLLLRFARAVPVASVQAGNVVVVEGKVVPLAKIKVLGTDIDCIFHDTVVESWQRGVRGGRAMWTPQRGDQELESFELDDGTGRILIWPEADRVDVRGGREDRVQTKKSSRSVTRYIAPGDIVRVRGMARVPPPPKKGKPRAAIEIGPPDDGKLVLLFRRPAPAAE